MDKCTACQAKLTELVYQHQKNNSLHLLGHCPNCGWRFLPFVPDLSIPITELSMKKYSTEKYKRAHIVKQQIRLL